MSGILGHAGRTTNLTKLAGALCRRSLRPLLKSGAPARRFAALRCVGAGAALWLAIAGGGSTKVAAQAVIAADGAYAVPIKSEFAATGVNLGLRLGRRIRVPSMSLTYELGLHYGQFAPSDTNTASDDIKAYRGVLGARLGLAGVLRPGVFAHLGVGRFNGAMRSSGELRETSLTHTAFTWDGGVYLDLAVASFFEFGFHASYNRIVAASYPRSLQWLDLGGHLQFVL
jgi:hypothetical protein